MVEIGTHSVIEKADVVTLDLTVRALQIYPNPFVRHRNRPVEEHPSAIRTGFASKIHGRVSS